MQVHICLLVCPGLFMIQEKKLFCLGFCVCGAQPCAWALSGAGAGAGAGAGKIAGAGADARLSLCQWLLMSVMNL